MHVLAGVLSVQAASALAAGGILILTIPGISDYPGLRIITATVALALVVMALVWAFRFIGNHRRDRIHARRTAGLMDTVLSTSREWLWAVDDHGIFTFSSRASTTLLGYHPSELIGRPCSLIIGTEDLARARTALPTLQDPDESAWTAAIIRCAHRDGSPVWMEISGKIRLPMDGRRGGFEGTSRPVLPRTAQERATQHSRELIQDMIRWKMLLTAVQPIHDLAAGHVLGAEAGRGECRSLLQGVWDHMLGSIRECGWDRPGLLPSKDAQ